MAHQVPIRVWRIVDTIVQQKGANWQRIFYSLVRNVLQYHSNMQNLKYNYFFPHSAWRTLSVVSNNLFTRRDFFLILMWFLNRNY